MEHRPTSLPVSGRVHAIEGSPLLLKRCLGGPQEKAIRVRVLKEVEELAVSKLEASQQSTSDASCQAAKQFLHEAAYEQVLPCPGLTCCLPHLCRLL